MVTIPEDMILLKASAWREKDIPDLRAIVKRHGDRLDKAYLRKWATWFKIKNPVFKELPARMEAILAQQPLPPGNLGI